MKMELIDTAEWMAWYRAEESQINPIEFYDPMAVELFTHKDHKTYERMTFGKSLRWAFSARTHLMDRLLCQCLEEEGIEVVVNIGCGYDARPWRLPLNSGLTWYDVDDGRILKVKEEFHLRHPLAFRYNSISCEPPAIFIHLERILLENSQKKVLILSEGLIYYMGEAEIKGLCQLIGAHQAIWWLTDYVSPGLKTIMNLAAGGARPKFLSAPMPEDLRWGELIDVKKYPLVFYAFEERLLPKWMRFLTQFLYLYPRNLRERWFGSSGVALFRCTPQPRA